MSQALQSAGGPAMPASWQGQFPSVGFLAGPVSHNIQEIKLLSVWLRNVHSTKSLISSFFVRAFSGVHSTKSLISSFFVRKLTSACSTKNLISSSFVRALYWFPFHQKLDFFLLRTKKNRQLLRREVEILAS